MERKFLSCHTSKLSVSLVFDRGREASPGRFCAGDTGLGRILICVGFLSGSCSFMPSWANGLPLASVDGGDFCDSCGGCGATGSAAGVGCDGVALLFVGRPPSFAKRFCRILSASEMVESAMLDIR